MTVNQRFLAENILRLNILKGLFECILLNFVVELSVGCFHHLVSIDSVSFV